MKTCMKNQPITVSDDKEYVIKNVKKLKKKEWLTNEDKIFIAIFDGDVDKVNELLNLGLLRMMDEKGFTPLHYSVLLNQPIISTELIASGIPLFSINQHDHSPIDYIGDHSIKDALQRGYQLFNIRTSNQNGLMGENLQGLHLFGHKMDEYGNYIKIYLETSQFNQNDVVNGLVEVQLESFNDSPSQNPPSIEFSLRTEYKVYNFPQAVKNTLGTYLVKWEDNETYKMKDLNSEPLHPATRYVFPINFRIPKEINCTSHQIGYSKKFSKKFAKFPTIPETWDVSNFLSVKFPSTSLTCLAEISIHNIPQWVCSLHKRPKGDYMQGDANIIVDVSAATSDLRTNVPIPIWYRIINNSKKIITGADVCVMESLRWELLAKYNDNNCSNCSKMKDTGFIFEHEKVLIPLEIKPGGHKCGLVWLKNESLDQQTKIPYFKFETKFSCFLNAHVSGIMNKKTIYSFPVTHGGNDYRKPQTFSSSVIECKMREMFSAPDSSGVLYLYAPDYTFRPLSGYPPYLKGFMTQEEFNDLITQLNRMKWEHQAKPIKEILCGLLCGLCIIGFFYIINTRMKTQAKLKKIIKNFGTNHKVNQAVEINVGSPPEYDDTCPPSYDSIVPDSSPPNYNTITFDVKRAPSGQISVAPCVKNTVPQIGTAKFSVVGANKLRVQLNKF